MSDRKLGSDDSAGKTVFYEEFMKINTEWWLSIVWAIGGWIGAVMVSEHSWRSPVALGIFLGISAGSFTMWYVIHLETKQGT